MTKLPDPMRLSVSADTDPALREALRTINQDVPDSAALNAFADAAERAVREGTVASVANAAKATGHSLVSKLVLASVVCGALVYAGLQRARVTEPLVTVAARPAALPVDGRSLPFVEHAPGRASSDRLVGDVASPLVKAPASPVAAVKPPSHHGTVAANPEPARSPALVEGTRHAPRTSNNTVTATTRPAAAGQTGRRAQTRESEAEASVSEITLLETAQRALARDPQRARELLDQHRSAFRHGQFAQERDVLALQALQQLGDTAALRHAAREFMRRYPRSPHRSRVERLMIEGLR
jgi:hypothetical protein